MPSRLNGPGKEATVPEEVARLQRALVAQLRRKGVYLSPRTEAAFLAVPRHRFLPEVPLAEAYADHVIAIKRRRGRLLSSASQPSIMALMLEQLAVKPGQRVLEIGTGTGYNAALLAELVGPSGRVISVEVDPELAAHARAALETLGYEQVEVICADGGEGHAPGGPYERLLLTAATYDVTPAWWAQLAPRGRLVAPLAVRTPQTQLSLALQRQEEGLHARGGIPCLFMMLRGPYGAQREDVTLPQLGATLTVDESWPLNAAAVEAWLHRPGRRWFTEVRPSALDGLALWLAVHEPGFFYLKAADGAGSAEDLWGRGAHVGLLAEDGLALLEVRGNAVGPPELAVRAYGPAAGAAQRLLTRVRAWNAAGRPEWHALAVRAFPADAGEVPGEDEVEIRRRWTRFLYRFCGRGNAAC